MSLPANIARLIDNARIAAEADITISFNHFVAQQRAARVQHGGGWSSSAEIEVMRSSLSEVRTRLSRFTSQIEEILRAARHRLTPDEYANLASIFDQLRSDLLSCLDRHASNREPKSVPNRNTQARAIATKKPAMVRETRHDFEVTLLKFTNAAATETPVPHAIFIGDNNRYNENAIDASKTVVVSRPVAVQPPQRKNKFDEIKDWFLKHWVIGALVFVIFAVSALAKSWTTIVDAYRTFTSSARPNYVPTDSADDPNSKKQLPSLRVTFADGRSANVNAYFQIHIERDDVFRVHRNVGPNYRSFLDTKVRTAAYEALERLTLEQARTSRPEIRTRVIASITPPLKSAGFTVDDFGITEIIDQP